MNSPELEAIDKVSKQVDAFNTKLGDKADKAGVDELKKTIDALKNDIGNMSEKEVDKSIKTINDSVEKMVKQMAEMQEDVNASKESKTKTKASIELYDEAEMKKQITAMFPEKGVKAKSGLDLKFNTNRILRTKAAEIMGYPDFFNGSGDVVTDWTAFTGRVIDPRLYERKRKRNFILDNMSISTVDAPALVYLEKVDIAGDNASQEDTGGAAWIAPGAQKPMRSFRVVSNKVEAKKVAIFGTVHDELLSDIPSMRNWIQTDFTDEIREEYNDGLLSGNPSVDEEEPLGLLENAVQYSDVAGFVIANPNDIDAIIATLAQLARNNETPAFVAVSSDKYYQLLTLKDSQQRYQNNNLVYTTSLGQLYIAGTPIVMADAEDVPTTHVLTIAEDAFQILNYGPLVFEAGLNGEDFRYDRTSFRAYQRVLSYIASHRYEAVIYDTFANIKTAIGS